ncbi:Uncharacterised protein (plasmid) [Tsukamurella tyrosinosolvens]|uniref:Uncharacterized protein n=1 Tax=Tsukamurella tyrosinosolvens TaxID=57704 RepID=A0A1H4UFE5_TSUTY|nr:hypothetical protein [Tsukamurella tyrosinosolvens]KXO92934.1 hypothetical protein AXK58_13770 [Tsukamurella tyrosinosolvens]SEC67447.1 hypothetical protein SAMN04489793_2883 [Tsukamurella tyrosinosolvens]VEH94187.1 Uncharacterised protein [Tsukamurella tyrosinosolvens]
MSQESTDRVLAAIDVAMEEQSIDDLVDWQLSKHDERSGYDWNVNQPTCGHCGRDEHHLAITERIERMRLRGEFEPDYTYAEDDSAILCPGSFVPGPAGFRRAHHTSFSPIFIGLRLDDGAPAGYDPFALTSEVIDQALTVNGIPNDPALRGQWQQLLSGIIDEFIEFMHRSRGSMIMDDAWELVSRFDADSRRGSRGLYQQAPAAPRPADNFRVTLFGRGGIAVRLPRCCASEPVPASEGFAFTLAAVDEGAGFGAASALAAGGRVVIEDRRDARRRIGGTLDTWTEHEDGTATITVRSARRSLPAAPAAPADRTRRAHERPWP